MEVLEVISMQVLLALLLPSLGHTDQTKAPICSYIRHLAPGTELGSALFLVHFSIFHSFLWLLFYWITSEMTACLFEALDALNTVVVVWCTVSSTSDAKLSQNAAGFAGPGGVGDGETPDSIRALRLHHHGGGPTTVCPLLEVATEWALSYGVCAVWIVTKDPGDLRLIAYLSKKITRGALV